MGKSSFLNAYFTFPNRNVIPPLATQSYTLVELKPDFTLKMRETKDQVFPEFTFTKRAGLFQLQPDQDKRMTSYLNEIG